MMFPDIRIPLLNVRAQPERLRPPTVLYCFYGNDADGSRFISDFSPTIGRHMNNPFSTARCGSLSNELSTQKFVSKPVS